MNQVYKKAVFLLAVILAIAYVSYIRNRVTVDPLERGGDTETYYFLANQLINEKIYAERQWGKFERFRAWRPPSYPIFLASALLVSNNNLSFVITLQYALLLISGLLIYLINDDSLLGAISSLVLFYSYSAFYFFASFFYSETLYIFILVLFLFVFVKATESRNRYLIGLAGLLFGVSLLVKTVFLPIFIIANISLLLVGSVLLLMKNFSIRSPNANGFVEFIRDKILSENLILFILISWLVIVPTTVRNFLVLNDFVLINSANGMNLFFGTRTDIYLEDDHWRGESLRVSRNKWDRIHEEIINPLREKFGEVGSQRELIELALREIIENPWLYISHKLHIIYRYVLPNINYYQFGKVGDFDLHGYTEFTKKIVRGLFFLSAILVVISKDKRSILLLVFFSLLVTSSSMAFFSERFVVITAPFYLMIVGRGFGFAERTVVARLKLT